MIGWTLGSLAVGGTVGLFLDHGLWSSSIDLMLTVSLVLLVLSVGVDLGRTWHQWRDIWRMGWVVFLTPAAVALGSLAGVAVAAWAMNLNTGEALAVGAGFGWYSLSGVLLTQLHSPNLGALAFATNVAREVAALILIPVVAKRLGALQAIAPAGATAMDTTLPLIARVSDPKTTVVAFFSGAVLSGMVPILVPLIIKLRC